MRRWWVALVGAAALAVSTACGSPLPYGIDGDLTDEWTDPGVAQRFAPAASGCFDALKPTAPLADYAPFDCAQRHTAEAYHVGELTGEAAAADATSLAFVFANAECERRAVTFLGADHRAGLLRIQPVLPGPTGWQSGARWFRCDLAQIDLSTDRVVSRTGTLRDALKGRSDLTLGCFRPTVSRTSVEALRAVDCAKPHDAEFAGLWTAPEITLDELNKGTRAAAGCRSTIAKWAKLPDDDDLQYRIGYLSFAPTPSEWDYGIRSVQCFLWMEKKGMKGSYRGAGPRKLPINFS